MMFAPIRGSWTGQNGCAAVSGMADSTLIGRWASLSAQGGEGVAAASEELGD
ncbi:hypothetical protein Athai_42250 [Actinocatenispora thailandica]|uniref:Uncharacterized protein n=1 Tax=Actinocatenispora thailandica TaxID=227318 RepID=A0A7R7DSH2_9ACTN|nr:hypothetical protein Athai_42250 [Actinocatenispora thailandica]